MKWHYHPARGGHAPDYLRTQLLDLLCWWEKRFSSFHYWVSVRRIAGMLWICTDVVPHGVCSLLDLSPGSTFAQAARCMRRELAVWNSDPSWRTYRRMADAVAKRVSAQVESRRAVLLGARDGGARA